MYLSHASQYQILFTKVLSLLSKLSLNTFRVVLFWFLLLLEFINRVRAFIIQICLFMLFPANIHLENHLTMFNDSNWNNKNNKLCFSSALEMRSYSISRWFFQEFLISPHILLVCIRFSSLQIRTWTFWKKNACKLPFLPPSVGDLHIYYI